MVGVSSRVMPCISDDPLKKKQHTICTLYIRVCLSTITSLCVLCTCLYIRCGAVHVKWAASGGTRTHDTLYSRQSALPLSYQGSSAGWAQISHLIVHVHMRCTFVPLHHFRNVEELAPLPPQLAWTSLPCVTLCTHSLCCCRLQKGVCQM